MKRTGKEPAPVEYDLPLRITVVEPPPGVQFCTQGRSSAELHDETKSIGEDLSFDLVVRAQQTSSGAPRFLGPFIHGLPSARFLYICSGTCAGQIESCWTRRAKIPLSGITWELVEEACRTAGSRLEARIAGRAKDGGPCCATVPLLDDGWRLGRS